MNSFDGIPAHGGERVARALKAFGVPRIFCLAGGHISPILVAAKKLGIEIVDTRHEATAVFAADATARTQDSEARAALQESLLAHLKQVNAGLEPHEKLGLLVVVTTPWTPENGFVTPTFKVKRNRIEALYALHYEKWVSARKPVIWLEA